MSYLETTAKFYSEAAKDPQVGLCCISTPPLQYPDLKIPKIMQQMNYGCGTTIHPTELRNNPTVLYIGVGGGLEALQFAYFCRRKRSIIAVDPVVAMREVADQNLQLAKHHLREFPQIRDRTKHSLLPLVVGSDQLLLAWLPLDQQQ